MSNDITPPIVLSEGTMITQVSALVRYVLTALGGYAIGKGWIESDLLELLTGLATVIIPSAYGIYKAYVHKTQLLTVEPMVHDTVMHLKR